MPATSTSLRACRRPQAAAGRLKANFWNEPPVGLGQDADVGHGRGPAQHLVGCDADAPPYSRYCWRLDEDVHDAGTRVTRPTDVAAGVEDVVEGEAQDVADLARGAMAASSNVVGAPMMAASPVNSARSVPAMRGHGRLGQAAARWRHERSAATCEARSRAHRRSAAPPARRWHPSCRRPCERRAMAVSHLARGADALPERARPMARHRRHGEVGALAEARDRLLGLADALVELAACRARGWRRGGRGARPSGRLLDELARARRSWRRASCPATES